MNKGEIKAIKEFVFLLLKNNYYTTITLSWLSLQVRAWIISMYVHACMTHPAVFVFGPVIRVWFLAERYLVSKCSVRNLTADNKQRICKCS